MNSANDFLLKEYELCYEQLRYYDDRHSSTLKYLLTLTSSIATAQFAIYKLTGEINLIFYQAQSFLSSIVFIASFLMYLIMLQNRVYFVRISKQLNSLRSFFCTNIPEFDNQLWTKTSIPIFKIFSVHSFQMLGAVLIASLFASSSFHAVCSIMGCAVILTKTIIFFLMMVAIMASTGIIYLKYQS